MKNSADIPTLFYSEYSFPGLLDSDSDVAGCSALEKLRMNQFFSQCYYVVELYIAPHGMVKSPSAYMEILQASVIRVTANQLCPFTVYREVKPGQVLTVRTYVSSMRKKRPLYSCFKGTVSEGFR